MSRLEISGYIQIIVGVVGIVVTTLTAPAALDAIGQMTAGSGVPSEFSTLAGMIRIFVILFVLVVLLFLVLLGLTITLSTLARALGSENPLHVAGSLVGAVFATTLATTFAVLGSTFWLPALMAALTMLVMAVGTATDPEGGSFWGVLVFGGFLFLGCGIIALMTSNPASERELSSTQIPATETK